jgi:hypothetical protein
VLRIVFVEHTLNDHCRSANNLATQHALIIGLSLHCDITADVRRRTASNDVANLVHAPVKVVHSLQRAAHAIHLFQVFLAAQSAPYQSVGWSEHRTYDEEMEWKWTG